MMPNLSRTGPTPIYRQIEDWIRQEIQSGAWAEHHKLKSEDDMSAQLGVSRGTVRKAITELIAEGLLVRTHGRGTFVSGNALEQPLAERLVTFSEDLISQGIAFDTHVLEQRLIQPNQRVTSLLSVPAGGQVFFLKRIRSIGGQPITLLHNYVAYDRCPGIEAADFTRYRLFEVLEEHFGLPIGWGHRSFEARTADSEVAHLLSISESDPVMYMEQIAYVRDDTPIELSDLWIKGDSYRLSAVLRRGDSSAHATGSVFIPSSDD